MTLHVTYGAKNGGSLGTPTRTLFVSSTIPESEWTRRTAALKNSLLSRLYRRFCKAFESILPLTEVTERVMEKTCEVCGVVGTETRPCKCGCFLMVFGDTKILAKFPVAKAVTYETVYRRKALSPDAHLGGVRE